MGVDSILDLHAVMTPFLSSSFLPATRLSGEHRDGLPLQILSALSEPDSAPGPSPLI